LEGSVFWDKRFDLSLNPLRDDLVFQIWDLDPFDRELLGEVRWEPGEWPNESFKEMTETGIELVVGAYWVPVPLMHVLEEPFHWE